MENTFYEIFIDNMLIDLQNIKNNFLGCSIKIWEKIKDLMLIKDMRIDSLIQEEEENCEQLGIKLEDSKFYKESLEMKEYQVEDFLSDCKDVSNSLNTAIDLLLTEKELNYKGVCEKTIYNACKNAMSHIGRFIDFILFEIEANEIYESENVESALEIITELYVLNCNLIKCIRLIDIYLCGDFKDN